MNDVHRTEQVRQEEQQRLDLRASPAERNRMGQFATPSVLASQIVDYAWQLWQRRPGQICFLDPAFGTGSFYSALLQTVPLTRLEHALGIELDAAHGQAARSLWKGTPLSVVCGDFTRQPLPKADQRFNLLVANPPYVRHHHLGRDEKARLQALVLARLGIQVSGLAGLYAYFMLLADQWLSDGSLSVWLVPAEFLDVNYGTAVKAYLKERVKLLHIHRFHPSDMQFADALVSSAVVVFEKAPAPAGHQVSFSLGGSVLKPVTSGLVSQGTLAVREKWSKHPRPQHSLVRPSTQTRTLGDLFTIKRGLATGANRFFILDREEALRRGIPNECLRPILPNPRQLPAVVIEADPDGYPRTQPQLALVDCRLPEDEIRRRFPAFWSYLEDGQGKKIHQGYLTSRRSPWYSQEDRPPAPFLCTYMGRSQNGRKPFRFLWNQSAATAHNVYLLLYPKGAVRAACARDPRLYGVVFEALHNLDTDAFMGEGRVYGGGLYKMEPKELAQVSGEAVFEALKGHLAGAGMERMLPFSPEL